MSELPTFKKVLFNSDGEGYYFTVWYSNCDDEKVITTEEDYSQLSYPLITSLMNATDDWSVSFLINSLEGGCSEIEIQSGKIIIPSDFLEEHKNIPNEIFTILEYDTTAAFGLSKLKEEHGIRPKKNATPYRMFQHHCLWRIIDCERISSIDWDVLDPRIELSRKELREQHNLIPKTNIKPIRKRHNKAGTCLYRVGDCVPIK